MKNILVLIFLLAVVKLYAIEDLKQQKYSSFEGRNFLIGFMQNEIGISDVTGLELQIFIACRDSANIKVTVPGFPNPYNYRIFKDSVIRIILPEEIEVRVSEMPVKSLVEISSDNPVSVYAFNSQSVSSDSYSCLPISHWGNEYVVVSLPNDQYDIPDLGFDPTPEDSAFFLEPRASQFMIIAAFDSTWIDFAPRGITVRGKQIGRAYTIMLNKGECYLVKSVSSPKGTNDQTGTIIRSDKPVGVLSGHVRSASPIGLFSPWDSKDHLVEMLAPTDAWGRNFVTAPFGVNQEGDLFRIVAINPGTVVTLGNDAQNETYNLDTPGSFVEIKEVAYPSIWKSNQPIQIAQFMQHTGTIWDNQNYDPCMVMIPPVEQFVSRILFQTPGNSPSNPTQYIGHYALVIADEKAVASMKLDGRLVRTIIPFYSNLILGTNYYWGRLDLSRGKHELIADSGGFAGILYGRGRADSYAMILGSSLTNPFKMDEIPPKIVYQDDCGNLTGEIIEFRDEKSTGIDFVQVIKDSTINYTWTIDKITDTSNVIAFKFQVIDIYQDAHLVIDFRDKNGNGKRFRYSYKAVSVELPNRLEFNKVDWAGESCLDFKIKNTASDTLKIKSVFVRDKRLTVTSLSKLPADLAPDQSISFRVCFKPNLMVGALDDTVFVNIDCSRYLHIPVVGDVVAPDIYTNNLNFGEVRVGEKKCDSIVIANKGNIPIIIDLITLQQLYGVFNIDTTDKLPHTILPGDTLKLYTCFTPDSTLNYTGDASALNHLNLKNNIKLTGIGIAPLFNSILIDWGDRRIGTSEKRTFPLENFGDAYGNINFKHFGFATTVDYDPIRDTLGNLNVRIEPDSIHYFELHCNPLDTLIYDNEAAYKVDSPIHKDIFIASRMRGTLPVIETDDVDFDTVVIYKSKSITKEVIFSTGNEELTIDSAYVISGDTSQFEFWLGDLVNRQIPVYSRYSLPLIFNPSYTGKHEIVIGVVNDALPSFARKTDTIRIYGVSIPDDTAKAELTAIEPEAISNCISSEIIYLIENTGNIVLELQNVELSSSEADIVLNHNYTLPHKFSPGEVLSFVGKILTNRRQDNIEIDFKATISDSIVLNRTSKLEPTSSSIDLVDLMNIHAVPGDTSVFSVTGKITQASEVPVKLTFEIYLPQDALFLNHNIGSINFNFNGSLLTEGIIISQSSDKIVVQTVNNINLHSVCDFDFEIELVGLLSTNRFFEVLVKVLENDCYLASEAIVNAELLGVCVFNSRIVRMIPGIPRININPNPASDKLELDINLDEDKLISFNIIDNLGKIINQKSNLFLKKGSHSIIFELYTLSEGFYTLNIVCQDYIYNKFFIKIK